MAERSHIAAIAHLIEPDRGTVSNIKARECGQHVRNCRLLHHNMKRCGIAIYV